MAWCLVAAFAAIAIPQTIGHRVEVALLCWWVAVLAIWIRSFFLRVRLEQDSVRIVSWYRAYRIPFASITRVDPAPFTGLGVEEANFLPLVGTVREIAFQLSDGKRRSFPVTVGRVKRVLETCRAVREAADAWQQHQAEH